MQNVEGSFIARCHYLGYTPLVGAQMRYAVQDREGRQLAMLGFSAAARKTAPRDDFIGWTPEVRERNLYRVINNSRFLIMPWIRSGTWHRRFSPWLRGGLLRTSRRSMASVQSWKCPCGEPGLSQWRKRR